MNRAAVIDGNILMYCPEEKELVFYEGGNHGVDQKRDEMLRKVEDFLIEHLSI